MNKELFIGKPKLRHRIWFYLTMWRPVTKYEYVKLQIQLINIIEGFRESDMQHYVTERAIIQDLKAIVELKQKRNEDTDNKDTGMFN